MEIVPKGLQSDRHAHGNMLTSLIVTEKQTKLAVSAHLPALGRPTPRQEARGAKSTWGRALLHS